MTTVDLMAAPLLEALEPAAPGPKVVALGGGHGLAQALTAIRGYAAAITAVVSVADDGGSSGRLAPALGLPPPGDCRRALLALSPDPSPWRAAVCHRFESGDVAGHSLGNLVLAALAASEGGLEAALATLGRLLGAPGPGGARRRRCLCACRQWSTGPGCGGRWPSPSAGGGSSPWQSNLRRQPPRPRPWKPWPRPTRW